MRSSDLPTTDKGNFVDFSKSEILFLLTQNFSIGWTLIIYYYLPKNHEIGRLAVKKVKNKQTMRLAEEWWDLGGLETVLFSF